MEQIMNVCGTCLQSAADEMRERPEDCTLVCTAFGEDLADHLCEEIENEGGDRCACACHAWEKRDLRDDSLLTTEIRQTLPSLKSTEALGMDAPIIVKFFTPTSNWTWYATEFDGDDMFFGLVDGLEKELGYFSLRELESVRGPYGVAIERDLYFGTDHTLKEFK